MHVPFETGKANRDVLALVFDEEREASIWSVVLVALHVLGSSCDSNAGVNLGRVVAHDRVNGLFGGATYLSLAASTIRQLPSKVVEDSQQIAIFVRRCELVQMPGL